MGKLLGLVYFSELIGIVVIIFTFKSTEISKSWQLKHSAFSLNTKFYLKLCHHLGKTVNALRL